MPIREVHTLNTLFSKVRSADSCGKVAESSVFTFRTLTGCEPESNNHRMVRRDLAGSGTGEPRCSKLAKS
jgi:hypothetical protein